jgi:lipopolysaccharide export system permease protein
VLKKVDRSVLVQFIGPLLFTFFVTDFIFLMQFLWKYIDELVGKGLEFTLILRLVGLFSLTMVPMALPLAILLASTMTLGGLGERSELVAFKSAGISLRRIMAGLMVFIIMLSVGAYIFSNNILPWSNLKFYSLLYDIRKHKPALDIEEGAFYSGINGFTFKIGGKGDDDKTIYDIMVYDHTSGKGNDNLIMAEKGEMFMTSDGKFLIMNLYNGKQYKDIKQRDVREGEPLHERLEMEFGKFRKVFDLAEFEMKRTDLKLWSENYHMLTAGQLRRKIDTLQIDISSQPKKIASYSRSFVAVRTEPGEAPQNVLDPKTALPSGRRDDRSVPGADPPGNEEYEYSAEAERARLASLVDLDSLPAADALAAALTEDIRTRATENARNMKNYINGINTHIKYKSKAITLNIMMIHKKFTLSVACIILFLIGAPMGAIVRRGGFGFPILISIIFFLFFHVLNITGEKLVKQLVWGPARGMWFPIYVLLPIGAFLTYKATVDSRLFNTDAYIQAFKKIFGRQRRTRGA